MHLSIKRFAVGLVMTGLTVVVLLFIVRKVGNDQLSKLFTV